MKVKLERIDDAFHFRGANEAGRSVEIDTSVEQGGRGAGAGPMQLVLMGLGGCSGIDVIQILKKARQSIESVSIELEAERAKDQVPAVFTDIHVRFNLTGNMDAEKVRRAIELSLEKYCSVAKMLEKTAKITYSFSVNGVTHEQAGAVLS